MENKTKLEKIFKSLVVNHTNPIESFCHNVITCKDIYGYTWQEIADATDISLEQLKAINGFKNSDYKLSTVVKLAIFFDISVEELVGSQTIYPETLESYQKIRLMPNYYREYHRWYIDFVYKTMKQHENCKDSVPLAVPECDEKGNLRFNTKFIHNSVNISNIAPEIQPKVFIGIKIPCNNYMPLFSRFDTLLIANDRKPLPSEVCVIALNGCFWFAHYKYDKDEKIGKFYNVNDLSFRLNHDDKVQLLGYIADIITED